MIGRALLAVAALGIAGCGSQADSSRGYLGGVGLFAPKATAGGIRLDVGAMTRYPSADDAHAERDRRFEWLSVRLGAGAPIAAAHVSKQVIKTSDFVDTATQDKSAWIDRWRVVVPAARIAAIRGRAPLTVRACDAVPSTGDDVHCEQRTIDVCVRDGRLRGEVTAGDPASVAPRGADGDPAYAREYSCRHPLFSGRNLDPLGDFDPAGG